MMRHVDSEMRSDSSRGYLLEDSAFEFVPFCFPGVIESEAFCYLRFRIEAGRCLVIVSQLPEYLGTDVTTGFKEIVFAFVAMLEERGIISFPRPPTTLWMKFSARIHPGKTRLSDEASRSEAINRFISGVDWIAVYPAGVGLSSEQAYALVQFDSEMTYTFKYRRKNVIAEFVNISIDDLAVDVDTLLRCSTVALNQAF